jgi:hypothetical protein
MPKSQALSPAFAGFRQLPGGGFSFTMVPNQFLDEIVPFEKPCVVKVVCLILRRTLGWIDPNGQRRQQDQVAYSEFAREMNMSTQAVADGLKIALDKGYIVRLKAGTMRDATSGNPEAACYSLRWINPLQLNTAASHKTPVDITNKLNPFSETLNTPDSDKQTAKPSLINRDMINKADSEKIKQVELKTNSNFLKCKKPGNFSSYIGNLVSEIGEQFGDGEHRLPNIKQALNCWEQSKLGEKEFARLLYQARDLTRQHTNSLANRVEPKQAPGRSTSGPLSGSWVTLAGIPAASEVSNSDKPAPNSSRNRMPYFFKVLRDLVSKAESMPPPVEATTEPVSQPAPGSSVPARKRRFALHNRNKDKLVVESREEVCPPVATLAPEEPPAQMDTAPEVVATVTALSTAPTEVPVELQRLAERFSVAQRPVLSGWQAWEASLHDPRIKALARRALPIERDHIKPELQPVFFPPINKPVQDCYRKNELLLVFRNAFDARYARSFMPELTRSLEQAGNQAAEVYIISL